MPESPTTWVVPAEPPELSVMVRVAVRVPVEVGENTMEIAQVPLGAMDRLGLHVVPEATE